MIINLGCESIAWEKSCGAWIWFLCQTKGYSLDMQKRTGIAYIMVVGCLSLGKLGCSLFQ